MIKWNKKIVDIKTSQKIKKFVLGMNRNAGNGILKQKDALKLLFYLKMAYSCLSSGGHRNILDFPRKRRSR